MLPVSAVAQGLRQFDIHLDGIDIVSVKVRRGGNAAELTALEDWGPEEWDVVGDHPASYQRQHLAGVADEPAAQRRRGGGP